MWKCHIYLWLTFSLQKNIPKILQFRVILWEKKQTLTFPVVQQLQVAGFFFHHICIFFESKGPRVESCMNAERGSHWNSTLKGRGKVNIGFLIMMNKSAACLVNKTRWTWKQGDSLVAQRRLDPTPSLLSGSLNIFVGPISLFGESFQTNSLAVCVRAGRRWNWASFLLF